MKIPVRNSFFVFLLLCSFVLSAQESTRKDSITANSDTVYSQLDVDIKAEYDGGDKARREFIEKKLNGQVATENGAPSGTYTVVVICIIDADGKIIAAVPETHHGYGMEKEVLRIINKLPKPFKPAIKNGIAVKSKMRFPVAFWVGNNMPVRF